MGGSDLGLAGAATQSHLRKLWEQTLPGRRVSLLLEDGSTKFGFVESAGVGSALIGWAHTPEDPEPGHMSVSVGTLLNGEAGWRLLTKADEQPRDIGCIIKSPHEPHQYRPEGVVWPIVPFDLNGWLDCPGVEFTQPVEG